MTRLSTAGRTFGRRSAFAAIAMAPNDESQQSGLADDFKLFATTWLGGLVFFGTLIA